ncbi:MAG: DUF4097 family beta strand repeat protein [Clostridia bacterium]|nr:DUF4097 family beta strand repeat protein [Clostridia bacterium]
MSKTGKFLIAAIVLIIVGCVIFGAAMTELQWDFQKLSTAKTETEIIDINGEFNNIEVNLRTTDIEFAFSGNDTSSILVTQHKNEKHSAVVENGTLKIGVKDTRKWYEHIGINFSTPKITVFLSKTEFACLSINTSTGNINIADAFCFESLKIKGSTANVKCSATVENSVEIKTSTGNVYLSAPIMGGLNITTSTGNVKIDSVTATDSVAIKTDTGNVDLNNTVISGKLSVDTDTGNLKLSGCDAGELYIKTSTGNVRGTLLSEKVFIANSSTGKIDVPKTLGGGMCEITTDTGDIQIKIE